MSQLPDGYRYLVDETAVFYVNILTVLRNFTDKTESAASKLAIAELSQKKAHILKTGFLNLDWWSVVFIETQVSLASVGQRHLPANSLPVLLSVKLALLVQPVGGSKYCVHIHCDK